LQEIKEAEAVKNSKKEKEKEKEKVIVKEPTLSELTVSEVGSQYSNIKVGDKSKAVDGRRRMKGKKGDDYYEEVANDYNNSRKLKFKKKTKRRSSRSKSKNRNEDPD